MPPSDIGATGRYWYGMPMRTDWKRRSCHTRPTCRNKLGVIIATTISVITLYHNGCVSVLQCLQQDLLTDRFWALVLSVSLLAFRDQIHDFDIGLSSVSGTLFKRTDVLLARLSLGGP